MTEAPTLNFDYLRRQLVGVDALVETPFGKRLMVYADYTASGRCLGVVEHYLQDLQRIYANTHTEDDVSGRSMTLLLQQAQQAIKRSVNAGPDDRIICVGTGATGAIEKLQQIVGVALPPVTGMTLNQMIEGALGAAAQRQLEQYLEQHRPVVFVGPYEHHSNEISWRESLATVVEVGLDADGCVDLEHLERLLQEPAYLGRQRMGSFSAASNVTGMKTPVHEIASLLHRHNAIACFDYAASAPYVEIDMNPPAGAHAGDASIDAVFISPHKFLGGPGSSGVLVFKKQLYHDELPPSLSAGGTVDYVGPGSHDFVVDIEERERAGTPGVLQVLKAGMAFELKDQVGVPAIEARERQLLLRVFQRWHEKTNIEILGNPDATRRISIVSFNLRDPGGKYLHPKFVTTLLNDLFGIQSRAGCSCAGPYGHRLLNIDHAKSEQYRQWIVKGYSGIKPGWCRISLHYVMDDLDVDYICDAVEFVADQGFYFAQLYDFDLSTGAWQHKLGELPLEQFSLLAALAAGGPAPAAISGEQRRQLFSDYLAQARALAATLASEKPAEEHRLENDLERLRFFSLPKASIDDR